MSELTLADIRRCIEGWIPAAIATTDASGQPNVTYLSAIRQVDDQRVALSNQFMSKTARNIVDNPRASMLVLDPASTSEYRLQLVFERTARSGPVFERLRKDVDDIATMVGMRDVFRLRTADIFRVEHIEAVAEVDLDLTLAPSGGQHPPIELGRLAELAKRLGRCSTLEMVVDAVTNGLHELLRYTHSVVFLLDETGERLFTIASHGFGAEGIGSDLRIGEGTAGVAAQRVEAVRVGDLGQMQKYGALIRNSFSSAAEVGPGFDVPLPSSRETRSRLAVPAISRGELVGVIVVESPLPAAFDDDDEHALGVVASLLAGMIDIERDDTSTHPTSGPPGDTPPPDDEPSTSGDGPDRRSDDAPDGTELPVRFFATDGSVFLGDDYLIRGVAGRVLWSLLERHARTGRTEVTLKELRLDRSLELPGFRDNLDTRVLLLKRRLDERDAPIRIHRSGRGRLALDLRAPITLDQHD